MTVTQLSDDSLLTQFNASSNNEHIELILSAICNEYKRYRLVNEELVSELTRSNRQPSKPAWMAGEIYA